MMLNKLPYAILIAAILCLGEVVAKDNSHEQLVYLYEPISEHVGRLSKTEITALLTEVRDRVVTLQYEHNGNPRIEINNCSDFRYYIDKGAYALSTYDMRMEGEYRLYCQFIELLFKSTPYKNDHIGELSKGWVNNLPVSLLPTQGGIYNDDGYNKMLEEHIAFLSDKKSLTDALIGIEIKDGSIEARIIDTKTINEEGIECWDMFSLFPIAKGDFTRDGYADLIVRINRLHRQENGSICPSQGTAASLGATSQHMLTRYANGKAIFVIQE